MSLRYLSSYRFVSHAWIRLAHKPASSSPLPFSYIRSPLCCAVLSRVQLGDCMDWARQAPLSMDRQDYWGGLPFPSPGGLSGPWFKPTSPASPALQVNSFFFFLIYLFFLFVVNFVVHWNGFTCVPHTYPPSLVVNSLPLYHLGSLRSPGSIQVTNDGKYIFPSGT